MRKVIFRGRVEVEPEIYKWYYGYLKTGKNTCIGNWIADKGEPIAPIEIIVAPKP